MSVDRTVGAQAREGRQHADEVGEPVHRPPAEVLEAEPVAHGAFGEETVVAGEVARREAGDFRAHRIGFSARAERRAVLEADLVKGVQRTKVDVLVEIAAAGRPEVAEELRDRDDGGTEVEAEAVAVDGAGAPAGHVEAIDHRDAVALGAEPHRCGQSPQPGADYDRRRARVGTRHGRSREELPCKHVLTLRLDCQIYNGRV